VIDRENDKKKEKALTGTKDTTHKDTTQNLIIKNTAP
jgi:hypothetical protein